MHAVVCGTDDGSESVLLTPERMMPAGVASYKKIGWRRRIAIRFDITLFDTYSHGRQRLTRRFDHQFHCSMVSVSGGSMRIVLALLRFRPPVRAGGTSRWQSYSRFLINKLNCHQHPFTTRFLYQIGYSRAS